MVVPSFCILFASSSSVFAAFDEVDMCTLYDGVERLANGRYDYFMKIYTKRGDKGDTDLFGGLRVEKNSLRIEAIGSVDELNSWMGMILASDELSLLLRVDIVEIQKDLFVLGADLATPGVVAARGSSDVPRICEESVVRLEGIIDRLEMNLEPMTAFILPGGCEVAGMMHVARSVCRRAERACVALVKHESSSDRIIESENDFALKYLNRLSDLLFVMSRFENHVRGVEEVKWKG